MLEHWDHVHMTVNVPLQIPGQKLFRYGERTSRVPGWSRSCNCAARTLCRKVPLCTGRATVVTVRPTLGPLSPTGFRADGTVATVLGFREIGLPSGGRNLNRVGRKKRILIQCTWLKRDI